MGQDEILDFYRQEYETEHQRWDTSFSRLNLPVGVLTLMVGALTYLFNNFPKSGESIVSPIFYALLFSFAATTMLAFYFLLRCFLVRKFAFISTLDEIQEYMDEVEQYYQTYPEESLDTTIVWREFFRSQYRQCSAFNLNQLDKKNGYFVRTMNTLFGCAFLLTVSAVPFYYLNLTAKANVTNVRIMNPKEVWQMSETNQSKPAASTDAQTPQEPADGGAKQPPPKPKPPKIHIRSEGSVTPRTQNGG